MAGLEEEKDGAHNFFKEIRKHLLKDGGKDRSRLIKPKDEVKANKQTIEDLLEECKQLRMENIMLKLLVTQRSSATNKDFENTNKETANDVLDRNGGNGS